MTLIEDRRAEVADAEVDLAEAQAFVAQLEERVRDGDLTVQPTDLAAARSHRDDLEEFARLRAEAKQRQRERAVEQERQAQVEQLLEDAGVFTSVKALSPIREAHAAAVAAMVALRREVDAHQVRRAELLSRAAALEVEPLPAQLRPGFLPQVSPRDAVTHAYQEALRGQAEPHRLLHTPAVVEELKTARKRQAQANERKTVARAAEFVRREREAVERGEPAPPDPSKTSGFRSIGRVFGDDRPVS